MTLIRRPAVLLPVTVVTAALALVSLAAARPPAEAPSACVAPAHANVVTRSRAAVVWRGDWFEPLDRTHRHVLWACRSGDGQVHRLWFIANPSHAELYAELGGVRLSGTRVGFVTRLYYRGSVQVWLWSAPIADAYDPVAEVAFEDPRMPPASRPRLLQWVVTPGGSLAWLVYDVGDLYQHFSPRVELWTFAPRVDGTAALRDSGPPSAMRDLRLTGHRLGWRHGDRTRSLELRP